jgi:putative transposase
LHQLVIRHSQFLADPVFGSQRKFQRLIRAKALNRYQALAWVVCALGRTLSVATLVAKLKVSSNQAFKGSFPSQFSWQSGYAAFSVAESTLESVVEYVSNQEEHHKRVTFQDEYRAILQRHHVNFDERYLWD